MRRQKSDLRRTSDKPEEEEHLFLRRILDMPAENEWK